MKESEQVKSLILSLLKQVGLYLENKFYSFKNIYDKDTSYVTENFAAQAEEMIVRGIKSKFPKHKIVGSKKPDLDLLKSSESLWIINALDGYSHFSRNIPIYTINLAFRYEGQTILAGVNYQSARQLFLAEKDQGATLNGLPIQVSQVKELEKSFVFVELPEKRSQNQSEFNDFFEKRMAKAKELIKNCKQVETFRIGALGQCLVASGAFDAYIDFSGTSTIYNQAASMLIVQEAGGEITHLDKPSDDYFRLMATNKKLTPKIIKILRL